MRPARFAFVSALLLGSASLSACGPWGPIDETDWTPGERGQTRWQISDGLCPGFGGGCALDVPLAVGASVHLVVDGVDGVPLTTTITGGAIEGDGAIDSGEDRNSRIPIEAIAPGTSRVEISDMNGVIDAASVSVRAATRLDCGRMSTGQEVLWHLPGLEVTTELTLPRSDRTSGDRFSLVCRAMDDTGPLLSERAITWEVIEGAEILTLNDDILLGTGPERGARIGYTAESTGSARVRATIGEVSQELTITIE